VYVNDLADNVSDEGGRAGKWAAFYALGGIAPEPVRIPLRNGTGVRSVTPQAICLGDDAVISLRVSAPGDDQKLRIFSGDKIIIEKSLEHTSPAEMIVTNLPAQDAFCEEISITVT
jgi:hypothetical protein